eukprot:771139-Amorphochlora_amoeboformis.AAC.1
MLASQSGHSPLVSSLLNKGARARFRSPTLNATARQLAVMAKHSGIALALAKAEMREGLFRGMVAPVMTEFDADQNLVTKVHHFPYPSTDLTKIHTSQRGVLA